MLLTKKQIAQIETRVKRQGILFNDDRDSVCWDFLFTIKGTKFNKSKRIRICADSQESVESFSTIVDDVLCKKMSLKYFAALRVDIGRFAVQWREEVPSKTYFYDAVKNK